MKYTAGEIKRAIIANTRAGSQRAGAMAIAAKYAKVSKYTPATSNRAVRESVVASIFGEMEAKETMKTTVLGRPVRGMTKKGLAKAEIASIEDHAATPTASEVRAARLAEKQTALKEAGLKFEEKAPTSKTELHVKNMARALDFAGVKALDAASEGNANDTEAASNGARKVQKIELTPNITIPRQVAPKKLAVAVDPFGEDDEK